MLTNKEILEFLKKSGITTSIGALSPAQAGKFIDTVVENSDFLKMISTEKNIKTELYLDTIGLQSRLLYKPTEGDEIPNTAFRGISTTRRSLNPRRVVLPYFISFDWLEKNIEGSDANEKIQNVFAKQFANDIVDLAWNGNTGSADPFLNILDGYITRAQNDSNTHYYNRSGSTDWKDTVFPNLYKLLPDKYKQNPEQLKYFVSVDVELEYSEQLSGRNTTLGDMMLTTKPKLFYKGIEVVPVFALPYGAVVLTLAKNLYVGYGEDIRVDKVLNPRAQRIEYYISARIDANYAVSDAVAYTV